MHCPHCFINRNPANLNAEDAVKFLESVKESEISQIDRLGFSGGEPFLRVDFLERVIKAAIDLDFMFDRIMTNGDWWKNQEDLEASLKRIYDAGYDGKIGLSYDSFHNQKEERLSLFIEKVWEIFGGDAVEIQSVQDSDHNVTALLSSLSERLNLNYEENIFKSGRGFASLTDDEFFLSAAIQTESFQSGDERAWKDKKWFKDDFCEGPGQILFVHATGDIAPCCGFANENQELFIGKITDSFDKIIENAEKSKMVRICYNEGLSSLIEKYKALGKLPSGKTEDLCTFCDFVCKNPI